MISFKQEIQNCLPRVAVTNEALRETHHRLMRVLLKEIYTWISRLSKGHCLLQCVWVLSNSLRTWAGHKSRRKEESRYFWFSGLLDFSFRIEFLPLVFGSQEFALYHRLSWVSSLQTDHLGLHNCTIYMCMCACVCVCWRRKWQHTPVFLPGEFHGQKSLTGYSPWSRNLTWLSNWTGRHVSSIFIFWENSILFFPQWLHWFTLLPAVYKGSLFSK